MNFAVDIYANLNHKYQAQFNFHFSKCINEIIFNQTTAVSTISFKDAVIYADTIEYLRRHYFIVNDVGVEEIFQRIGMLAGFYANAVLLRYEYPMMIVTKTKEIFLKRLKRNKKMLTEEGSSDESRSKTLSRSIQLHTSKFLDSVESSQLSKKTTQLRDQLFPEFKQKENKDKSYDSSIHDIHNPSTLEENSQIIKKQTIKPEDTFTDKLLKLSKNISLTEMVDNQAVEVNLSPSQNDVNFLICDFDEIDRQKIIEDYTKLQKKQKKTLNSQSSNEQLNRFKKKSQMNTSPIDFNDQNLNHEKTLQNPKYRKLPKQMQYSAMQKQLKSRQYYDAQNSTNPKLYTHHPTRNSLFINPSQQVYEQLQESYKTLQRFRPGNFTKPTGQEIRHIYNNQQYRNRQKTNSYRQNLLPRQKSSSNIFQYRRYPHEFEQVQQIDRKRKSQNYQQTNLQPQIEQPKYPHVRASQMLDQRYHHQRYDSNRLEQRYVHQFIIEDQNRMKMNSPKFKDLRQHERRNSQYQQYQTKYARQRPEQKISHLPISTQKIIKNQYFGRVQEPRVQHSIIEQLPSTSYLQSTFQQKQEKKKRIRQKAAQLLSRVKSHQYLTTKFQTPYQHRY